jgi:hypothetical protein
VARTEADTAQRTLIAADIKRFLERPLDPTRPIPLPAPDAPPGAPIRDWDQDWLAPPPAYGGSHPVLMGVLDGTFSDVKLQ